MALSREPEERVAPDVVIYLNRLGDLLFVMCRCVNAAAGIPDTVWKREE